MDIQIISNENIHEATMSRTAKSFTVWWDGVEYEAMRPTGMFVGGFLASLVRWRYSLTNRQQQGYLAAILGEAANFILYDTNSPALPNNFIEIVVLLAISIQRLEIAGVPLNLKRGSNRKGQQQRSRWQQQMQQTKPGCPLLLAAFCYLPLRLLFAIPASLGGECKWT